MFSESATSSLHGARQQLNPIPQESNINQVGDVDLHHRVIDRKRRFFLRVLLSAKGPRTTQINTRKLIYGAPDYFAVSLI